MIFVLTSAMTAWWYWLQEIISAFIIELLFQLPRICLIFFFLMRTMKTCLPPNGGTFLEAAFRENICVTEVP